MDGSLDGLTVDDDVDSLVVEGNHAAIGSSVDVANPQTVTNRPCHAIAEDDVADVARGTGNA